MHGECTCKMNGHVMRYLLHELLENDKNKALPSFHHFQKMSIMMCYMITNIMFYRRHFLRKQCQKTRRKYMFCPYTRKRHWHIAKDDVKVGFH